MPGMPGAMPWPFTGERLETESNHVWIMKKARTKKKPTTRLSELPGQEVLCQECHISIPQEEGTQAPCLGPC